MRNHRYGSYVYETLLDTLIEDALRDIKYAPLVSHANTMLFSIT
jgi:hypothetical protein